MSCTKHEAPSGVRRVVLRVKCILPRTARNKTDFGTLCYGKGLYIQLLWVTGASVLPIPLRPLIRFHVCDKKPRYNDCEVFRQVDQCRRRVLGCPTTLALITTFTTQHVRCITPLTPSVQPRGVDNFCFAQGECSYRVEFIVMHLRSSCIARPLLSLHVVIPEIKCTRKSCCPYASPPHERLLAG